MLRNLVVFPFSDAVIFFGNELLAVDDFGGMEKL
jgi:hypothetical protein